MTTGAELVYRTLSRVSPVRVWQHLQEGLANQWLPADELKRLQWLRLRSILHHCYRNVPFYRDLWRQHDVDPTRFSCSEDMKHLPVVNRSMLSKARLEGGFASKNRKTGSVQFVMTSGTAEGRPFAVMMDRRTYERKYANHLKQFYAAGWRLGTRSAALHHAGHGRFRGRYSGNTYQREPWHLLRESTFRIFHRRIVLQPYASEVTGNEEVLQDWHARIRAFSPQMLDTFYINLLMLGDYAERAGLEPLRIPRMFVLNTLTDAERRRLKDTFGGEVFNRYSPHEGEGVAVACAHHAGMHVAADSYYVEVVAAGLNPLPVGETGRVVLTDLENYTMPLVRYDIGDMSRLLEGDCPCGRTLPRMSDLEGRFVDALYSTSGDVVTSWQVERLFQGLPELRCFQVVQSGSSTTLSVVPANGSVDRSEAAERYRRGLRGLLGAGVSVQVEWVEGLPFEPNGKYRFVKNGNGLQPEANA